MKQILIISGSVWRRLLRLKSLYFLTACGIALMAISCSYKYLMGFEQKMLMTDVALVVTNLATILCVLALAFDIPRELKSGTATMLLSKPLGRNQFLLGKLLGILIVTGVVTGVLFAGYCVLHQMVYHEIDPAGVKAMLLTIAAVVPMAGMALLFGALLDEAAAAILTAVCVLGFNSLQTVREVAEVPIVYGGIIPDLGLFNVRSEAAHIIAHDLDTTITWNLVGLTVVWGVIYTVGLFAVTSFLFNRRDLS